ncbi:hypothetical protein BN7_6005 [Wickerhamomyces ciferrii]|uniref:Protein phosphatase n=1 Tax=Wickerhamomyces ciferrii (strain ATCC 14091 / BCRC 22168 / CBS 111 / JCM 3599 / NBRC 0793 / NRRL Y-1031 F-60-10) TaxID=1206466 RepID=K0KTC1_WICCF|nr:uncharacterized protein BN7_6005 [Wickerhamomyces ciferrii]CCH46411.1 hypothetical protein BN7_6005 [Wickerhamomyces ciferrii]
MLKTVAKSGNRYWNNVLRLVTKNNSHQHSLNTSSSQNHQYQQQEVESDQHISSGTPRFYYKPITNSTSTPSSINSSKKKSNSDFFKFEYSFASFVHHGRGSSKPLISSLMDLTDSSNNLSLLPRRRLYGNPIETLSIKNGDDAMIVSPNLIGVADGVSGWSGAHANSGLFARSFLENISRNFSELSFYNSNDLSKIKESDLSNNLDYAYKDSLQIMKNDNFNGSSTLLLGMIIDKNLKIMNIGDSKIFIIRQGKIVKTNKEQYISNFSPEQVGTTIKTEKLPSSVVQFQDFPLEQDDLILICSDGVTDNLYQDEILDIIMGKLNKDLTNLQEVSNHLLYKTKNIAYDNYCVCPYVEKVNELSNQFITGGKLDDISICISKVMLNE